MDNRAPRTEKRCRICREAHWRAPTGWIADHISEPVDFPIEAEAAADPVAGEVLRQVPNGRGEPQDVVACPVCRFEHAHPALPTLAPEEGEGE